MLITLTQEQIRDLRGRFSELSNSMTRIEAERDLMKEIYANLKEDFELHPKIARKLAKIYHKRNIVEVKAEAEEVESIYDSIVPTSL